MFSKESVVHCLTNGPCWPMAKTQTSSRHAWHITCTGSISPAHRCATPFKGRHTLQRLFHKGGPRSTRGSSPSSPPPSTLQPMNSAASQPRVKATNGRSTAQAQPIRKPCGTRPFNLPVTTTFPYEISPASQALTRLTLFVPHPGRSPVSLHCSMQSALLRQFPRPTHTHFCLKPSNASDAPDFHA